MDCNRLQLLPRKEKKNHAKSLRTTFSSLITSVALTLTDPLIIDSVMEPGSGNINITAPITGGFMNKHSNNTTNNSNNHHSYNTTTNTTNTTNSNNKSTESKETMTADEAKSLMNV